MMPKSKIKEEFLGTVVAFGGGGPKPLGERDDIDRLAIIAQESQDKSLLNLFEVLPSLHELKEEATDAAIEKAVKSKAKA